MLIPHPDDEALGCSGTISLLTDKGVGVTACYVTSGERLRGKPSPEIAAERNAEARRASKLLGCSESLFLGFPDGDVGGQAAALSAALGRVIAAVRPELVLAPSPLDFHADHIALGQVALQLLPEMKELQLVFYEVYSTLRFNCLIDITAVINRKQEAISNYRLSLYDKPEIYIHAALGLNAHRSIFTQQQGYYEAFHVVGQDRQPRQVLDYLSYRS